MGIISEKPRFNSLARYILAQGAEVFKDPEVMAEFENWRKKENGQHKRKNNKKAD